MPRVLFSAFGSGGDLFPLIPVAERLQQRGVEVMFAVPRALGLYLRVLGFRSLSLGDGTEMSMVDDDELFTTRFSGWASQRRLFVRVVAPTLAGDVEVVRAFIDRWAPDVVVTSTYAVGARIAALASGVAHVSTSIYPPYLDLARTPGRSFSRPFLREVESVTPPLTLAAHGLGLVAWGAGPGTVLLHDPVLLGHRRPAAEVEPVGFPSWDALPTAGDDLERTEAWLASSDQPVVAVTLGSFIGVVSGDGIDRTVAAVRASGCRALILNVPARGRPVDGPADRDVLRVGFVPLSLVLPAVSAVIHHGGMGTTFATMRAGRPAVVTPQAFDQPLVAALVEAAGLGLAVHRDGDLGAAVRRVVEEPEMRVAAVAAARRLIPAEVAVAATVERVLEAAGRLDGGMVPNGPGAAVTG